MFKILIVSIESIVSSNWEALARHLISTARGAAMSRTKNHQPPSKFCVLPVPSSLPDTVCRSITCRKTVGNVLRAYEYLTTAQALFPLHRPTVIARFSPSVKDAFIPPLPGDSGSGKMHFDFDRDKNRGSRVRETRVVVFSS